MPLAMSSIITMAENTKSIVEISYYEIYMDRCYDLLEPKNKEIPVLKGSEGLAEFIHISLLVGTPVKTSYLCISGRVHFSKATYTVPYQAYSLLCLSALLYGVFGVSLMYTSWSAY